jgi:hypothetical protein
LVLRLPVTRLFGGLIAGALVFAVTIGIGLIVTAAEAGRGRVDADPTLPVLPVVARPPASQPPIGLPSDTHLDTAPPRRTVGFDLIRNGWTYDCMECHTLIPAKWRFDRPMVEHRETTLEHGNNRFCLNCHHASNRNAFSDYDGTEIAQANVVQLCAKCHGPTYRDWQAGVHGRQNGFWRTDGGPKTKLLCIQCHDPHRPKRPDMKPLAPLRYPPRGANPPMAKSSGATASH